MAEGKRTDSGIYIGVIGAGRTDGIEKERSRRKDLDMIRQICLLTIVLFDLNEVVQSYPASAHINSQLHHKSGCRYSLPLALWPLTPTLAEVGVRSEFQTHRFEYLLDCAPHWNLCTRAGRNGV